MRILYCNKYNFAFSGTEVYLSEVMELMRGYGHEAALFSMADPRGVPTPYDKHFVPFVDFKNASKNVLGQARQAAHAVYSRDARRRLRGMLAEFRPDVAHIRNIYHHLSPSILWELQAQGVPVVYHLNDFKLLCPSYNMVSKGRACERCRGGKFWHVISEGCYNGARGSAVMLAAEAYAHKWLRTYLKCVDCFLAPSQFVKDKLIENGWDRAKIEVLPHFQRLDTARNREDGNARRILYFGRLSSEKGVDDLLRAMQQLPGLHLRIAGDGPQRYELEQLAKGLKLRNVEFVGHLQGGELSAQISSARFTVFPSRAYETLGKSILESYACSRAVVASDLGSRRELVHEGKTGLLFPPGDIERLANAISFFAEHPQQSAEMGRAGSDLVRDQHSPEAYYAALTQLYERLRNRHLKRIQAFVPATKPKLRVAFIGGRGVISKYSGIETYYEEAGKRLAGMGHQVTVYCRTYFTPPIEQYNGMRLVRLPTIRSKHLDTLLHTFLSTLHALFQDCDIVHYHALGPALFSFLPRLFGKKTVVTVQGLDWQRKKWGKIASAALRLGEQASVRLPNATMVVSHTLQEHYQARHGVAVTYVPNGANIRKRHERSQKLSCGASPGNYILFVGRFSPEKNCHLLIEAYARLGTPVKLILAGGSSYSDAYANELRRHESDKIHVLDWVAGPEMDELITHAMLFVLPSDLEGLSLALLDAMGAGVCVLASDIPENREVVEGVGFTFKHGDVDDLERMLRLLIADKEIRTAAAKSAQKRVRERYLWAEIAKQIDGAYQELTSRKKSRVYPLSPIRPNRASDRGKNAA